MSFKSSLKLGELGQAMYHQAHQGIIEPTDGFKCDFKMITTGEAIEVKADYWSMNKTPNFFFERYSDKDKGSPGGPWQSQAHGTNIFVYIYVQNFTFFTFQTDQLVEALEKIIPTLPHTDIKNSTWITRGYRVPRELLKDLYVQQHMEVRIKK